MKLTSPAFKHGEVIPKKFTCEGQNVSPALLIEDAPKETQSFALIVDDPDAPGGTFVHWVIWDIPAGTKEIQEGFRNGSQGLTDFLKPGYRGPCPPPGKSHTYRFKLYALDFLFAPLFEIPPTLEAVESFMKGHILAKAELRGKFQRR